MGMGARMARNKAGCAGFESQAHERKEERRMHRLLLTGHGANLGLWRRARLRLGVAKVTDLEQRQGETVDHLATRKWWGSGQGEK